MAFDCPAEERQRQWRMSNPDTARGFLGLVESRRMAPVWGMALAPMAVLPEYQRQGIGSQLVQRGIEALKEGECPFIILVGHPAYYPRFGFEPASQYGIRSEWAVPDDAFMILVLNEQQKDGLSGTATYRPEFTEAA